jgi:transposase-like protein
VSRPADISTGCSCPRSRLVGWAECAWSSPTRTWAWPKPCAPSCSVPGCSVTGCTFISNVLATVHKANGDMVAALIHIIFAQPDAHAVREQLAAVATMLGRQFPKVQAMLEAATDELLAFAAFPVGHWKKI